MIGHRPSPWMSNGCVVPLRGNWVIFCHACWIRKGWRNVISQGKTPWNTMRHCHCQELNPGHGEDRQRDIFILLLSYHNQGHREDRQWDTFILPLSYHDPGHGEDRQRDTFILPLSYHDPGHGEDRQWYTFILPLSYHDPGQGENSQWDTFFLPLSYHDTTLHKFIPN